MEGLNSIDQLMAMSVAPRATIQFRTADGPIIQETDEDIKPVKDHEKESVSVSAPVVMPLDNVEYYSSEVVASELGVSSQTIRNYTKEYDEFIKVYRGDHNQRMYTVDDVAILRYALKLRTQQHLSPSKIKDALRQNIGEIKSDGPLKVSGRAGYTDQKEALPAVFNDESKKATMEELTGMISSCMEEKIKSFFDVGMEKTEQKILDALSSSSEHTGSLILEQSEIIRRQKSQIEELEKRLKMQIGENASISREVLENMKAQGSRQAESGELIQQIAGQNEKFISEVKSRLGDQKKSLLVLLEELKSKEQTGDSADIQALFDEVNDRLKNLAEGNTAEYQELASLIREVITPPAVDVTTSDEYAALKEQAEASANTVKKAEVAISKMTAMLQEKDLEANNLRKRLLDTQDQLEQIKQQMALLQNGQGRKKGTDSPEPDDYSYVSEYYEEPQPEKKKRGLFRRR